ncbi:MAG: ABC transporter ATP-binding protein [Actinomycetota bacterium]
MIAARGLSRRLGRVTAVYPADFEIETGSCIAVFGPNGAGKTTLLKLIAGLLRPSTGTVEFNGKPPRAVRAGIGYLGHEPYLYPQLTAEENLRLFAGLYRVKPGAAAEKLAEVGMETRAGRPVGELSRGEIQRCGLARALLHDPDYLIVDEPFSSVDSAAVKSLAALLKRPGRTVLISTHDRALGESLSDRVIEMASGRLGDGRR